MLYTSERDIPDMGFLGYAYFFVCATSGNEIPGICMFWRPLGLCPGGRFQRKSWEILWRWRWVCALVAAGWVYAPAPASKRNPLKSLEMAPDSWDTRTFLFVQPQQPLNVYGIKDSWDMHTFFLYNLIWNIRGIRGRGVCQTLHIKVRANRKVFRTYIIYLNRNPRGYVYYIP